MTARMWPADFVPAAVATSIENYNDVTELKTEIRNKDGVHWFAAPLPPRMHGCTAQTMGRVNFFNWYERCACGATRYDGESWINRNTRIVQDSEPDSDLY